MEHARRSQALRQRATRRRRPRETPETLLEQIEHYATRTEPGGSGGAGGRADKRGRPSNESIVNRILGEWEGRGAARELTNFACEK